MIFTFHEINILWDSHFIWVMYKTYISLDSYFNLWRTSSFPSDVTHVYFDNQYSYVLRFALTDIHISWDSHFVRFTFHESCYKNYISWDYYFNPFRISSFPLAVTHVYFDKRCQEIPIKFYIYSSSCFAKFHSTHLTQSNAIQTKYDFLFNIHNFFNICP